MTTPITRRNAKGEVLPPTSRVTDQPYRGMMADARGRRLIVSLLTGDMISIRPQGTRRVEYGNLSDIYDRLLRSRVLSERMQKINHKKRSRK